MRTFVLTETERKIIQRYLDKGEKLENFKVILHRCRNLDWSRIDQDKDLIKRFLERDSQK